MKQSRSEYKLPRSAEQKINMIHYLISIIKRIFRWKYNKDNKIVKFIDKTEETKIIEYNYYNSQQRRIKTMIKDTESDVKTIKEFQY